MRNFLFILILLFSFSVYAQNNESEDTQEKTEPKPQKETSKTTPIDKLNKIKEAKEAKKQELEKQEETQDTLPSDDQTPEDKIKDEQDSELSDQTQDQTEQEEQDHVEDKSEAASDDDEQKKQEEQTSDDSDETKTEYVIDIDEDIIKDSIPKNYFTAPNKILTDRVVNIFTTSPVRKGFMVFTLDYRPYQSFNSVKDLWHNYLGFDEGNHKLGLGFRFGIMEDILDMGFYRLSNGPDLFDVYEFDSRIRFLIQDLHYINMGFRLGVTWFSQRDAKDASGFLGQLMVDRKLFGCLLMGVGFAVHSNSSNEAKYREDDDASAALLGYLEWRPLAFLSVGGELSSGIIGYKADNLGFSVAVKLLTKRHSFSFIVSNVQHVTADGIVTNSARKAKELIFGLQLSREFKLF